MWNLLYRLHQSVAGAHSWYAPWQAVKAELVPYLPNLAGFAGGGTALIGSLLQDIGWVGVFVLTFAAFVAARQLVLQGGLSTRRRTWAAPEPKQELQAKVDAPTAFSFEYQEPEFIHPRTDEDGKRWKTVRIRFRTDCVLKEANPYLLCVRRHENGRWSDDKLASMRSILGWPGSGNRFVPRRIEKKESVLLVDYDEADMTLSFVTNKKHTPFSIREFMDNIPPGKYLLDIGVASENMGMVEDVFILDWFGNFETISLQRATKELT